MKLTEKLMSLTQRVIVYGPPKSGKTELVGRLAQHYNLLWLDCDQGWSTLKKLPKEYQDKINLISIPDSRVLPMAAESWPKIIKGSLVSICNTHGKVGCAICMKANAEVEKVELNKLNGRWIVVFDSITQFTNSLIAHITKEQPDDYKLEFDDWGKLKVLIEKFLSQIQAAGYNVVCITHEEEVIMEDGKVRIVPSSGSSKSSRNTARYFDHVVYCEVKNKKHNFGSSTDYGMNVITGSRTGIKMETSKEPSLLDIFTSWKDWDKEDINVPDIGLDEVGARTNGSKHSSDSDISTSPSAATNNLSDKQEVPKTPGQIALDNMKLKAAELIKSNKGVN